MENSFFCQWFKGFEKGLDEIDSDSRIRVEQVETILSGDMECKFRVIFD